MLATGELGRVALGEILDIEAVELPADDDLPLFLGHLTGDTRRHVVLHRKVGEEHVVLEEQGRLALLGAQVDLGSGVEEDLVVHHDAALVRGLDTCDTTHGDGFTAARGTQQAHHLGPGIQSHLKDEVAEILADIHMQAHHSTSFLR